MIGTGGGSVVRSPRWVVWLAGLLACSLLHAGCDEYRISMRARGGAIERTFSLWDGDPKEPKPFGGTLTARLAKAYGKEIDDGTQAVTGSFSDAMPQDVGGAGSYTRILTPLGSSNAYLERFRGTDDLIQPIEESNERIDRLTELIAGWLEAELGEDPDAKVLGRFVRERIRPDLKNLHLYLVTARLLEDGRTAIARIAQYLAEREYFEIADLPRLSRRLDDEDDRFMRDFVARLAAKQLGVSSEESIPEKLSFLRDSESLSRSFEAHARTAPEFRRWVEAHPEVEEDEQFQKWLNDVIFSFLFDFSFESTALRVALELPEAPVFTNGTWDAATRRVEWAVETLPDETEATAFAYAIWAEPAPDFQEAHFGRVLLRGEALSRYAFAYAGLTVEETSEWDAFIAALVPGEALLTSIRSFHFSDESLELDEEGNAKSPSRAADLISLLSDALEATVS